MLLEMLAEAGRSVVAGEALSGKLGIAPPEVFRRVGGLRRRGYRIDAVKGGYRLVDVPDLVGPLEIGTFLTTREMGRTLHYRESVPSTNDVAFRLAREGAFHGDMVVAEHQTLGRGRRGRRWVSPRGRNLYFSLVLRPDLPAARAPELTFLAAVALAHTLEEAFGLESKIKWPNDLRVAKKKVAGVLPELFTYEDRVGFVVLGIGLNVNMTKAEMPEEIATEATSLAVELGQVVSRPLLLAAVLSSLESWYEVWSTEGFEALRDAWLERNETVGSRVRIVAPAGSELLGEAIGVDDGGVLLLRLADGSIERVHSGEVMSASLDDGSSS